MVHIPFLKEIKNFTNRKLIVKRATSKFLWKYSNYKLEMWLFKLLCFNSKIVFCETGLFYRFQSVTAELLCFTLNISDQHHSSSFSRNGGKRYEFVLRVIASRNRRNLMFIVLGQDLLISSSSLPEIGEIAAAQFL